MTVVITVNASVCPIVKYGLKYETIAIPTVITTRTYFRRSLSEDTVNTSYKSGAENEAAIAHKCLID